MLESDRRKCIFFLFLALWLIVSPICFNYAYSKIGISECITGSILLATALLSFFYFGYRNILFFLVIGFWLVYSPIKFWVLEPSVFIKDSFFGYFILFTTLEFEKITATNKAIPMNCSIKISGNPSHLPKRYIVSTISTLMCVMGWYFGAYEIGFSDAVWDPFFGLNSLNVFIFKAEDYYSLSIGNLFSLFSFFIFLFSFQGDSLRFASKPWIPVLSFVSSVFAFMFLLYLVLVVGFINQSWSSVIIVMTICSFLCVWLSANEFYYSILTLRKIKSKTDRRNALWHGVNCSNIQLVSSNDWGMLFSFSRITITIASILLLCILQLQYAKQPLGSFASLLALFIFLTTAISLNKSLVKITKINLLTSTVLFFGQWVFFPTSNIFHVFCTLYSVLVIYLSRID